MGRLRNFGHDPRNPVRSLVDTQAINLTRVMGEHVQAGVKESASQMFYGGTPTTKIDDPELQKVHNEGFMQAHNRLRESYEKVLNAHQFLAATAHLSDQERQEAARAVIHQAVADTSPNSKWRQGERSPNIEQAEEVTLAAVQGREPRFIAGRLTT